MDIMNNAQNEWLRDILVQLSQSYYTLYPNMLSLSVNVDVTDSLSRTHFELRPDLKDELIEQGIERDDESNGRMVLPKSVDGEIHILLNSQQMTKYTDDGSMTWMGTFAHELTHAIDYYQMAIKEELHTYDPLLRTDQYLMFQLWTEYHARRLGYGFLRNQLNVDADANSKNERITHILSYEWPNQFEIYLQQYNETNDGIRQMYYTMQLLGRFSVWCDLFPNVFTDSMQLHTFNDNLWMKKLLDFFELHDSLADVHGKFEGMRLILKENWEML